MQTWMCEKIIEKLEEIRCGIIDVENAIEKKAEDPTTPPVSPPNSSDLLCCPFCGGAAGFEPAGGEKNNMAYAYCSDCFAQGEEFNRFADNAKAKAKKAWNKRAI